MTDSTPAGPKLSDSMPYFDEDFKRLSLLQQELAREEMPPATLHRCLPPPFQLFTKNTFLRAELERIENHQSFPLLDRLKRVVTELQDRNRIITDSRDRERDILVRDIQEMKLEREQWDDERARQTAESARYKEELSRFQSDVQQMEGKLQELGSELDAERVQMLHEAQLERAEWKRECGRSEAEVFRLRDDFRDRYRECEDQARNWQAQYLRAEEDKRVLTSKVDDLRERAHVLEQEKLGSEQEKQALEAKIEDLEREKQLALKLKQENTLIAPIPLTRARPPNDFLKLPHDALESLCSHIPNYQHNAIPNDEGTSTDFRQQVKQPAESPRARDRNVNVNAESDTGKTSSKIRTFQTILPDSREDSLTLTYPAAEDEDERHSGIYSRIDTPNDTRYSHFHPHPPSYHPSDATKTPKVPKSLTYREVHAPTLTPLAKSSKTPKRHTRTHHAVSQSHSALESHAQASDPAQSHPLARTRPLHGKEEHHFHLRREDQDQEDDDSYEKHVFIDQSTPTSKCSGSGTHACPSLQPWLPPLGTPKQNGKGPRLMRRLDHWQENLFLLEPARRNKDEEDTASDSHKKLVKPNLAAPDQLRSRASFVAQLRDLFGQPRPVPGPMPLFYIDSDSDPDTEANLDSRSRHEDLIESGSNAHREPEHEESKNIKYREVEGVDVKSTTKKPVSEVEEEKNCREKEKKIAEYLERQRENETSEAYSEDEILLTTDTEMPSSPSKVLSPFHSPHKHTAFPGASGGKRKAIGKSTPRSRRLVPGKSSKSGEGKGRAVKRGGEPLNRASDAE